MTVKRIFLLFHAVRLGGLGLVNLLKKCSDEHFACTEICELLTSQIIEQCYGYPFEVLDMPKDENITDTPGEN